MKIFSSIKKKNALNEKEREAIYDENKKMSEISPVEKKELALDKSLHTKAMVSFQKDRMKEQRIIMWVGVGFGAVGIVAAGAMAVAIAIMMPLKEVKPYISEVDQVTGVANVISAIGDDKIKLTYQNLMDASNLQNFVINRESYDWNSIQNSLDKVKLQSSNGVYEAMRRFIVESPNSPLQILAKDKIMKVGVVSRPIVNSDTGVATVRFYKAVTDDSGKVIQGYPVTHWQATITFDYNHKLSSDEDILNNPLGFNVTSYRVDQEAQK